MRGTFSRYFKHLAGYLASPGASRARELPVVDPLRHWLGQPHLPSLPAGLHGDIMRAVQRLHVKKACAARSSGRLRPRIAWGLAGAAALLVACWCAGFLPGRAPTRDPASSAMAATLTTAEQLPRTAPQALISPLQAELDRLSQDFRSSAEMLLASLP